MVMPPAPEFFMAAEPGLAPPVPTDVTTFALPDAPRARLWRTEGGIVSLNETNNSAVSIRLTYGLANLVSHPPHRIGLFDLHHPLTRQYADAALLPGP